MNSIAALCPDISDSVQQAMVAKAPAQQAGAQGRDQAVKAAKEFESIFVHKLLDEMRQTIPQSGLTESEGSEQVQGIFWFELAQELGNKGALGLWKQVYRQMTPAAPAPAGIARPDASEPQQ